jgi:hypothetical protein
MKTAIKAIESEIRRAIIALEIAKSNCFDEPMIDKKYNIEKAEQDIIKHTIEYFTEKDIS